VSLLSFFVHALSQCQKLRVVPKTKPRITDTLPWARLYFSGRLAKRAEESSVVTFGSLFNISRFSLITQEN
jgi:hypothetical protein